MAMRNQKVVDKYFSGELEKFEKFKEEIGAEYGLNIYPFEVERANFYGLKLNFLVEAFRDTIFEIMDILRDFEKDEMLGEFDICSRSDGSIRVIVELIKPLDEREYKKAFRELIKSLST